MKKSKPWKKNLDLLTPKQLAKYDDSLEVLRMMRQGSTFSSATRTVGISPSTVRKFLGKTLSKKENRVTARKNDSLIRQLKIYENGKEVSIQIRGIKKASIIGKYHSAVGRRISKNQTDALESFEDKTIQDIFGKTHTFESDIDEIITILERQEEPEFFKIYKT